MHLYHLCYYRISLESIEKTKTGTTTKKNHSKTVQTILHKCGAVWLLLALNKNLPSNRAGEKQCNILAFEFSKFVKENVEGKFD